MFTPAFFARDGDVRDARVGARRARAASPLVELRVRHAGDRATRRARAHAAAARVPARRSRRDVSAPGCRARRANGARRRAVGSFSSHHARQREDPHAQWHTPRRAPRRGRAAPIRRKRNLERDRVRAHSTARRRARPTPNVDASAKGVACVDRTSAKKAAFSTPRTRSASPGRLSNARSALATRRAFKASTCKTTFSTSFSSRRAGHPRVSELLLKPPRTTRRRRTVAPGRSRRQRGGRRRRRGHPSSRVSCSTRRRRRDAAARRARVRTVTSTPRSRPKRGAFVARHALAEKAGGDGDVPARPSAVPSSVVSRRALRPKPTLGVRRAGARRGASIDVDRFAEPASNMPASHATEAPSAPGFGAAALATRRNAPRRARSRRAYAGSFAAPPSRGMSRARLFVARQVVETTPGGHR